MMNVNLTTFVAPVLAKRRFRYLLMGLMVLAVVLGIVVVPVEKVSSESQFNTWGDGLWWAAITVTGVGYGDIVPVTFWGRVIGVVLAVVGVTAFGLIVGMFTIALENTKEKYYRSKWEEQWDRMEARLSQIEKQGAFLAEKELKKR